MQLSLRMCLKCVWNRNFQKKKSPKHISDEFLTDFDAFITKNGFEKVALLFMKQEFRGKRTKNAFQRSSLPILMQLSGRMCLKCVSNRNFRKRKSPKHISDTFLTDFDAFITKNGFEQVVLLCMKQEFLGKRANNTFQISYWPILMQLSLKMGWNKLQCCVWNRNL